MMWREKKPETSVRNAHTPVHLSPEKAIEVAPMLDSHRTTFSNSTDSGRTQLGRSIVLKGDLAGSEDLVIAGQFEGSINVEGHCVTIGPEAKVNADIQAARVVIHGSVHGNISVRERLDIYKTGHVVGDLLAPGLSIEDGAFFKGKIEIVREETNEAEHPPLALEPKQAATVSPRAVS